MALSSFSVVCLVPRVSCGLRPAALARGKCVQHEPDARTVHNTSLMNCEDRAGRDGERARGAILREDVAPPGRRGILRSKILVDRT